MFSKIKESRLRETMGTYFTEEAYSRSASSSSGKIVLISDDQEIRTKFKGTIANFVTTNTDILPVNFQNADLGGKLNVAAVVLQITDWEKVSKKAVEQAELFCRSAGIALILRVDLNILDDVLGAVEYPQVEILLSDSPAELLVALNMGMESVFGSVFAGRDEIDVSDLRKISADVERIARALVQLSGPKQESQGRDLVPSPFIEPDDQTKVSDAPVSFKAEETGTLRPLGSTNQIETQLAAKHPVSADDVRNLIKARRLRDHYFNSNLFADPAWDMLLDLLAARLEDVKVSVSSLCIAAHVPPTTALRWIKTMTEEKIFLRKADEHDGRRIFIELSDEATASMIGFFKTVRRDDLILI